MALLTLVDVRILPSGLSNFGPGMPPLMIGRRRLLAAGSGLLLSFGVGDRMGGGALHPLASPIEGKYRQDRRREADAPSWWQLGTLYQIYPLSFQDSDGDGKGDLGGLISRLDYLSWLGIGAVWISPIYPSPMADFGYDVSDYENVGPIFGDLRALDRLIEELHRRGMKLMLDFVPNHTSIAHPWFVASRASRTNPKRDWYLWVDPARNGGPPNNWLSRFGGSAWTFDPPTGQYYYHSFLKEQPDLNWRNAAVRAAMAEILRFWLRRGIDGFRIDSAGVLIKDAMLRDDPPNPKFRETMPPSERFKRVYTDSRPETVDCLAELRAVADEFPDKVLLGEVDIAGDRLADFYGRERPCLNLPLNYGLRKAVWAESESISRIVDDYLGRLPEGAWPCWASGCHDMSRIASRAGVERARAVAMLLFSLPGTTIIYAGDEIGMGDVHIPPARALDPLEHCMPGYGLDRDAYRAPMRWDSSPHGGFTAGEPWLPVGDSTLNVADGRRDPRSLLALYRRLIALKIRDPIIGRGDFARLPSPDGVVMFIRRLDKKVMLVSINLSNQAIAISSPPGGIIVLSTELDRVEGTQVGDTIILRKYEGIVRRYGAESEFGELILGG